MKCCKAHGFRHFWVISKRVETDILSEHPSANSILALHSNGYWSNLGADADSCDSLYICVFPSDLYNEIAPKDDDVKK